MAKKRVMELDETRRMFVLNELTDMYIKNGGAMPTHRMIKKNSYITVEEVDCLRTYGDYTERRIRHLAEEKTGQKFKSSSVRRIQSIRDGCYRKQKEKANVEDAKNTELQRQSGEKVSTRRPRHPNVSREDALEDLRAIVQRLGHMPTQKEISDRSNEAKYCYSTYVQHLGLKSSWAEKLKD